MKLAFYKGKEEENPKADRVDKAVCWWTCSRFSHCELIFGENTFFSASGRDGGVRFKTFNPNPVRWEIYDIGSYLVHRGLGEEWIRSSAETYNGQDYDYIGIFLTIVVPLGLQSTEKWWCSEIIGSLLNLPFKFCKSPETLFQHLKKYGFLAPL